MTFAIGRIVGTALSQIGKSAGRAIRGVVSSNKAQINVQSDVETATIDGPREFIKAFQKDLDQAGRVVVRDARSRISQSVDVFNQPMPPLKSGEPRRPMMKTLRMFNSFRSGRDGAIGIRIENTAPYSGFQNSLRRYIDAEKSRDLIIQFIAEGEVDRL